MASRKLGQKGGRGMALSSRPNPLMRLINTAGMIRARPAKTPGTMPAANKAGTLALGTLML